MHLCNFGNDAAAEIPKRQGPKQDIAVLKSATKISVFWITETQARAVRVTKWQKQGLIKLDNKNYSYPWVGVSVSGALTEQEKTNE